MRSDSVGCSSECLVEDTDRDGASLTELESQESRECCEPKGNNLGQSIAIHDPSNMDLCLGFDCSSCVVGCKLCYMENGLE